LDVQTMSNRPDSAGQPQMGRAYSNMLLVVGAASAATARSDAIHARLLGEGQGCPESNLPCPLFTKEGDLNRTVLGEFFLGFDNGHFATSINKAYKKSGANGPVSRKLLKDF